MAQPIFEQFTSVEITDRLRQEAVQLFSENYGIWAASAPNSRCIPGSRVKLSKNRLRDQYLPAGADCSYIRATFESQVVGQVVACRWKCNSTTVCWITQLVVHRDYRERGLATSLVKHLKQNDDDGAIYGIMSSHPAACLAAANAFALGGMESVPIDFIGQNAASIMKSSPIPYVRDAEPRGSLFEPGVTSGVVSSVDTHFFVDHTEPLAALTRVVRKGKIWPLGKLLDGHEFLLIIAA